MTISLSLDELKKQAKHHRQRSEWHGRKAEDYEATMRVMESYGGALEEKETFVATEDTAKPLGDSGAIDINDLSIPKKSRSNKPTLANDIKGIINRIGVEQEFTVMHIYAALKQMGKATDAKHYRNRISITIKKFTDDSILVRAHKGKGNDPHRYKAAPESS